MASIRTHCSPGFAITLISKKYSLLCIIGAAASDVLMSDHISSLKDRFSSIQLGFNEAWLTFPDFIHA